jgi:hypothetical protein
MAMATDSDTSSDEPLPPPEDVAVRPHRRRRVWPWIVAAVILAPVVGLALWTVVALNFSYSHGYRAGYVQKFSRKGWVCKTHEGELAMVNVPGAMQERWTFTVRDDSVAALVDKSLGQRVSLAYDEHAGLPTSCFGDTRYFVTGIQVLGQ